MLETYHPQGRTYFATSWERMEIFLENVKDHLHTIKTFSIPLKTIKDLPAISCGVFFDISFSNRG